MKIVILTNNGSEYGKWLIRSLTQRRLDIEKVIVINQPLSYHIKLFGYVKKRVGLLEALLFSAREVIRSMLKRLTRKPLSYEQFQVPLLFTDGTNTESTESALKAIEPDILILAQTGIVRKNILSIPKRGTLNAHPGILPYYRGIDCCKWAILNDEFDKIGATLHWVNAGVDTGNIIECRPYAIDNRVSFDQLDDILYHECVDLLKDHLARLRDGAVVEGIPQRKEEGKQYYKMSLKNEWRAEKKFTAFMLKKPAE